MCSTWVCVLGCPGLPSPWGEFLAVAREDPRYSRNGGGEGDLGPLPLLTGEGRLIHFGPLRGFSAHPEFLVRKASSG